MTTDRDQAVSDLLRGTGIHHEFAADVEEKLRKAGINMYGCPLERVEPKLDGTVAVWFSGIRKDTGVLWRGAIRANVVLLEQAAAFADSEAVSQVIQQIIAENNLAWKEQGTPEIGCTPTSRPGFKLH
jgi:hypothetical protein